MRRYAPQMGSRQQVMTEVGGVNETASKPRAMKGNLTGRYKKDPMKEIVGKSTSRKWETKGGKRLWKVGASLKRNNHCTYRFRYRVFKMKTNMNSPQEQIKINYGIAI